MSYQSFLKSISKSVFIAITFTVLFAGHQAFAVAQPPDSLQTTPTPAGTGVSWVPAVDSVSGKNGIQGYNLYYGLFSGIAADGGATIKANTGGLINQNQFLITYALVIPNAVAGQAYSIAVESVDTAGAVSTAKATTMVTIPSISAVNDPTCSNGAINFPTCTAGAGTGGGYNFNVKFINPLCTDGGDNCIQDIPTLLNKILDALMLFLVPIVVLFIIYSGFLFVMAQGNDVKLTKAKSVLGWTLVGAAILLGAKIITTVLSSTVTNILK